MRTIILALMVLLPAPALAEVVAAGPSGFHVRHSTELSISPTEAFRLLGNVGRWWSPDHSYSGDAANLSLQLVAGGCFCEKLPGGGVEHLRVAYVDAPKRVVLTGALGPLLYQGVAGSMDIRIEPAGSASKLTLDYRVAGFASGGADKLAGAVDGVLGEQVRRLQQASGR